MNRSLPPGDCGNRRPASGGALGPAGIMPGAGGLGGGIATAAGELGLGHRCATFGTRWLLPHGMGASAKAAATGAQGRRLSRQEVEKPAATQAGRAGGKGPMLLVDSVSTFSAVGLEGLHGVAGFLHRAGHESADGVLLPAHLIRDLLQRGAALPLEHGDHLSRLAALARPGAFLGLGGFSLLGRFLSRGSIPAQLGLSRRVVGCLCATLGFLVGLWLLWLPQTLDPVPNLADSCLGGFEPLHRLYTRQAVPSGNQPLRRPTGGQFRQFLLTGEGIEGGSGRRGGFFRSGERADVVLGIDRKRPHVSALFPTDYRDDHIHHSGRGNRQAESALITGERPMVGFGGK
jgi:hypothetical protein